ncbi:MAG: hypothetical protein GXO48_05135 [Chlorobi bacterium]|nr:hypothetical protein [Chlorobiota bacterium]
MVTKWFVRIILGSLTSVMFAQEVDTLWTRLYDFSVFDEPKKIIATNDRKLAIMGKASISGLDHVFIAKIDREGNLLWNATYGTGSYLLPEDFVQTSDGGFLISGQARSSGNPQAYILKLDSTGNFQWERFFEDPSYLSNAKAIVRHKNAFYLIVERSVIGEPTRPILYKLNTDGTIQWQKQLGCNTDYYVEDIVVSPNGYLFIITQTILPAPYFTNDMVVFKVDTLGNTIYSKLYGFSGNEYPATVLPYHPDSTIVLGNSLSFKSYRLPLIIKTNEHGDTLWTKVIDEGTEVITTSMALTSNKDIIITGYISIPGNSVDVYVARVDQHGNRLWMFPLGGRAVERTANAVVLDSIIYVVATTFSFGDNVPNVFLIAIKDENYQSVTAINQPLASTVNCDEIIKKQSHFQMPDYKLEIFSITGQRLRSEKCRQPCIKTLSHNGKIVCLWKEASSQK